jgi:nitroreductase
MFGDDIKDEAEMRDRLMEIDPVSLRAVIHQSSNLIDVGLQCYALRPKEDRRPPEKARSTLRIALKTWEKRGFAIDEEDIKYAHDAVRRGDEFEKSLTYELSLPHSPFGESDLKAVQRIIVERRSIRRFSAKEVPDDIIDKVIWAGIWAPSTYSLQGCRFIVVMNAEIGKLFMQPIAWGAPVIIVACLDRRPYRLIIEKGELPYGAYLDLGIAVQNMSLMAHALGLGSCIGTFIAERDVISRELNVPENMQVVTYLVLGWPEDAPTTVPRMRMEEFVSREKWQGD